MPLGTQALAKLLIILVACTSMSACGITARHLHRHNGYAEIDSPYWWQADNEVNLSIGPTTLRALRWAINSSEEPEIKALLKEVKGVRISVYNVDDNQALFKDIITETQTNLHADNWQNILKVNDENETTMMFMKAHDDVIDGLVVLTLDDSEAVFINVIGNIEPEAFTPLMSQIYRG